MFIKIPVYVAMYIHQKERKETVFEEIMGNMFSRFKKHDTALERDMRSIKRKNPHLEMLC